MENIKVTVESVIQQLAGKKPGSLEEIAGESLKKSLTNKELSHIKFNYFRNGIASFNVDSSAWLFHLSLRKRELLEDLSKDIPDIKDIRFHIGETQCQKTTHSRLKK